MQGESLFNHHSTLNKWSLDLLNPHNDDCDDVWDYPFQQLISTRDKLVQFKIVHHYYLTSERFGKLSVDHSTMCWRCDSPNAGFLHIFWNCLEINLYWSWVLQFIATITNIQTPLELDVCLLGLVELLAHRKAIRMLLGLLLYYARKTIVLLWKYSDPPTLKKYIHLL